MVFNSTKREITLDLQKEIDKIADFGGGKIIIPVRNRPYIIGTVYVKSSVTIEGEAHGENFDRNEVVGTVLQVKSGGLGLVIGEDEYSPRIKGRYQQIRNLSIQGKEGSISGIRVGSDVSFITVANSTIENCFISGFNDVNVQQPVYDNSTPSMGSDDSNFDGAFNVRGGCGIFIASGINVKFNDVVVEKCFHGVAESAGNLCTNIFFTRCYFRLSVSHGVYFTTAISTVFINCIIETSGRRAIQIHTPVVEQGSTLAKGTEILFLNCHIENNFWNSDDNEQYTVFASNDNEGKFVKFSMTRCRIDTKKHNGIYINRGRSCYVTENTFLINTTSTSLKTENTDNAFFKGEPIGLLDTDSNTIVDVIEKQPIIPNRIKLAADYRSKFNSGFNDPFNQSIIIGGDIAILPRHMKGSKTSAEILFFGETFISNTTPVITAIINNVGGRYIIFGKKVSVGRWKIKLTIAKKGNKEDAAIIFTEITTSQGVELTSFTIFDPVMWDLVNRVSLLATSDKATVILSGYEYYINKL